MSIIFINHIIQLLFYYILCLHHASKFFRIFSVHVLTVEGIELYPFRERHTIYGNHCCFTSLFWISCRLKFVSKFLDFLTPVKLRRETGQIPEWIFDITPGPKS